MKTVFIKYILVFAGFLIIWANGCEKSHLDPQSADLQVLPSVQNLKASVGNNLVVLTWEYTDSTAKYRVFRRDSVNREFQLINSVGDRGFSDAQVVNGTEYAYQVQVVDSRGYSSPRSSTITATPALFGLQIEYGRNIVNHSTVHLELVAPTGTTEMCLANDESASFSQWQPFAASIQWYLSPTDGLKKVWAKFRNAAGIESESAVMDSVCLDTQARIFNFTLDAPDGVLSVGDTLHFALDAREKGGVATAQIGRWFPIDLYDDGTNSDHVAQDGIYENTIVIPPGADVVRAPASGFFQDAAGNEAVPVTSAASVTIQSPPAAVQLLHATRTDSNSIVLNWSLNEDPDFYCYEILVSKYPDIPDTASPDTVITEQTQNSVILRSLAETTVYYFKVIVVDEYGARVGSNELSARIFPQKVPEPVFLSHPLEVTPHSVTLQWTPANPANFLNYRIVQYDSVALGDSALTRTHIIDVGNTSWTDSELAADHVYKYQVFVFNKSGQFSKSNLIYVKTPVDAPPEAVILSRPVVVGNRRVRLTWTRNTDSDFKAYFIYRSTNSPVILDDSPDGIINNSLETSFIDSLLSTANTYYYKIGVVDFAQNKTESNEVEITFPPDEPGN